MDAYEATRIVFARIQSLEPENVYKIMGYLLLQDHGDQEMIRLAFGPETLVQSLILKAKKELGLMQQQQPQLGSTTVSSYLSRINRPGHLSQISQVSPRVFSSPTALSPHAPPWGSHVAQQITRPLSSNLHVISSEPTPTVTPTNSNNNSFINFSTLPAASMPDQVPNKLPVYVNHEQLSLGDDQFQLQDQLSFLNDFPESPNSNGNNNYLTNQYNSLNYPELLAYCSANQLNMNHHLMSPSANCNYNGIKLQRPGSVNADICTMAASDHTGSTLTGWKPCMYFARGYCKNGSNCRFLHTGFGDHHSDEVMGSSNVGSLEMLELELQELLRGKRSPVSIASLPQLYHERFGKTLQAENYLTDSQRYGKIGCSLTKLLARLKDTVILIDRPHGQHAVMLAEDAQRFTRFTRSERDELVAGGGINPGSRQIYLTFPAESTFREEDVSNYFSIYGPVQDVRIPYQQKRMFGFVTFVFPDTVKIILSKGNPHYVCDARVLVKPYREKGSKPVERKLYTERGEYSGYMTTHNLDAAVCKEHNLHLGPPRLLDNSNCDQAMRIRQQLEEQELEHAIELQGRRLAELQLVNDTQRHVVVDQTQQQAVSSNITSTNSILNQDHDHQNQFSNGVTTHSEEDSKFSDEISNSTLSDHFGYLLQVLDSESTYEERPKHINHHQERLPLAHGAIRM
eukprot:Gb_37367 [translate_table: standard]